ncbi:hypothetical protein GGC63_004443 [Paenibacillus sp. OAS669]|nr:hypothetical protein [Paenibacillus sp. OAS669]
MEMFIHLGQYATIMLSFMQVNSTALFSIP